jgi:hypothetical protein
LQELPQLVDLNARVHIFEPLLRVLDRFLSWRVGPSLEIRAGLHFDHKFARQLEVDGI